MILSILNQKHTVLRVNYFHYSKTSKFQNCEQRVALNAQSTIICSKLTKETQEQGVKYVQRRRSGVFIINFEHISHFCLVFLLLTLSW